MGTTVQLYPSSVYAVGGGTVTVTGAANAAAALDASTSSYDDFIHPGAPVLKVNVGGFTLPANCAIYGVRCKMQYTTGFVTIGTHLGLETAMTAVSDLSGRIQGGGSNIQVTTGWGLTDPTGALWTQALVNSTLMRIWDDNSGTGAPRVFWALEEILYYAQPTISGITPSGAGSNSQPQVGWTFNGDGLGQTFKRVKIFSQAQYSAGGFDPETSASYWDSGETSSNQSTQNVGVALADGNYRIYVKAASTVGQTTNKFWSNWAYSAYTLDRGPNVPTLTSPAPGATASVDLGISFSWSYSHPDPAVGQGAYAFRRKTDGGAYEYWRESDQSWQGSVQWNTSSATTKTFGAGIWTNGHTFNWSVSVQDADGDQSGFASDSTLISNSAPTCTITSPTGTITNTSRPLITWSYSDADLDLQDAYEIRVWSAQLYGGFQGSFPWDGYPTTWTTGIIVGADIQYQLPVDLDDAGNVWVFAMRVHGGGQWSDWTASFVTVALDRPWPPDLTAVLDNTNARAQLTAQGHDNMLPTDDADFEGGTGTWVSQAGAGSIAQNATDSTHGAACLGFSSTASGTVSIRTASGTSGMVVQPNTAYTFRVDIKPTSNARATQLTIRWYKSDGSPASTQTTTGSGGTPTLNTWKTNCVLNGTSPADAAFAAVQVDMLSVAGAGETFRIDKAGMCIGTLTSTWWCRGGLQYGANLDFDFEYSDDNSTWYPVRYNKGTAASVLEAATAYDYELPARNTRYYRVKASSIQVGLANIESNPSTTQSVNWSPQSMWIKDLLDPTRNRTVKILSDSFNQKSPLNAGKFYTQGQTEAIVISERFFRSRDWDMTIQVISKTDEQTLDALMVPGRTLLLQDVIGENTYFRISDASERNLVKTTDLTLPRGWAWNKKYTVTEVASPDYP